MSVAPARARARGGAAPPVRPPLYKGVTRSIAALPSWRPTTLAWRVDARPMAGRAGAGAEVNESLRDGGDDVCRIADVTVSNTAHAEATVIVIRSARFAGLLRLVGWTLNGLGLRVVNATLYGRDKEDPSLAFYKFWVVSSHTGRGKVRDTGLIEEYLVTLISTCQAEEDALREDTVFRSGCVELSNARKPGVSVITVRDYHRVPGLLLEITSTISGLGLEVVRGVVCTECERQSADGDLVGEIPLELLDPTSEIDAQSRVFVFDVTTSSGRQLNHVEASALMFAFSMHGLLAEEAATGTRRSPLPAEPLVTGPTSMPSAFLFHSSSK